MSLTLFAEPTGKGEIHIWSIDITNRKLATDQRMPMPLARVMLRNWYAYPDWYGLTVEELKHIHSAMIMEDHMLRTIGENT